MEPAVVADWAGGFPFAVVAVNHSRLIFVLRRNLQVKPKSSPRQEHRPTMREVMATLVIATGRSHGGMLMVPCPTAFT